MLTYRGCPGERSNARRGVADDDQMMNCQAFENQAFEKVATQLVAWTREVDR